MDPREKLTASLPGVHGVTYVTASYRELAASFGEAPAACVDLQFRGTAYQVMGQSVFFRDAAFAARFAAAINALEHPNA